MQLDFFNTIQSVEPEISVYNASAKSQEDQVLEVFAKQNKPLAWFMVASYLPDMNEVSLKRSISNLANKGKLVKDTQKANMVLSPEYPNKKTALKY